MKTRLSMWALGLLLSTHSLAAQDWPGVIPGEEIRIVSSPYTGTATVVRADLGGLELSIVGLASLVSVPIGSVDRLEARVQRTGWEGARRGAAWGALIGAALGGFGDTVEDPDGFWDSGEGVILGMAVVGAGIGALIGAARPGYRWDTLVVPVSLGLMSGPNAGIVVGGRLPLGRRVVDGTP